MVPLGRQQRVQQCCSQKRDSWKLVLLPAALRWQICQQESLEVIYGFSMLVGARSRARYRGGKGSEDVELILSPRSDTHTRSSRQLRKSRARERAQFIYQYVGASSIHASAGLKRARSRSKPANCLRLGDSLEGTSFCKHNGTALNQRAEQEARAQARAEVSGG